MRSLAYGPKAAEMMKPYAGEIEAWARSIAVVPNDGGNLAGFDVVPPGFRAQR
jgi:hypothetical protein